MHYDYFLWSRHIFLRLLYNEVKQKRFSEQVDSKDFLIILWVSDRNGLKSFMNDHPYFDSPLFSQIISAIFIPVNMNIPKISCENAGAWK